MQTVNGTIEVYSFSTALGGSVIGGWIDFSWNDPIGPPTVVLRTDAAELSGKGLICLFPRDDVKKQGLGYVLLVDCLESSTSRISEILIHSDDRTYRLLPADGMELYSEERILLHAKHFLQSAPASERRSRFRRLLERPYYKGEDTLSALVWPVHLEVDSFYFCPPQGMVVRGWFLDPFHRVARIRLCGGGARQVLDPESWIVVKRRDVADAFAPKYGSVDELCGFIAYAPTVYNIGQPLFFELESVDGTVAFRPAAPSLLTGLAAIKEILSCFDLRRDALVAAYDHIVGPAVEAMNAFRLKTRPEVTPIAFGVAPASPRCSIIVPLYGRVDFLEYQLAFFADTLHPDHEILYVLDDPNRAGETEALAASAFARYERPFKLLVLSHNVGFAPANNIGLEHAAGSTVCFLNSDVFPQETDWLEYMIETLETGPDIGLVGARLLYEDGSLQHDGCTFERLPEFGNWPFPMHPGKGRHIEPTSAVADADIVTGACMVMARTWAKALGGFDEGYVIGDFEDADLCLRLAERGLRSVVDNRAKLYHLERQSQNLQANAWRMNLTLYNAWRFQTRWRHREF